MSNDTLTDAIDPSDLPEWLYGYPIIPQVYVILVLSLVFLVPSTALFVYQLQRDPQLQQRSANLTLVAAGSTIVCCPIWLLASARLIPCFLCLWAGYITTPLWVSAFLLRAWRLVVLSAIQKEITVRQLTDYLGGKGRGSERKWQRWLVRRKRLTETKLLMMCGIVSAVYLAILIPVQVIEQIPAFYLTSPPQRCPAPWIYYPLYASLVVAIFLVAPYVVWRLSQSDADELGIRQDLLVTAGCAAILYLLFLVFTLWSPDGMYRYFGPLEFVLFVQLIGHYTSVAHPAWVSIRRFRRLNRVPRRLGMIFPRSGKVHDGDKDPEASSLDLLSQGSKSKRKLEEDARGHGTREAFYMALAHEPTFERLEAMAVANFAAETTFFLRALSQLEAIYREGREEVVNGQEDLCRVVCDNFLRNGAPFEVNVSSRIRQRVFRRMEAGERNPDIFSEAKLEVEELIFTNIYLRFPL